MNICYQSIYSIYISVTSLENGNTNFGDSIVKYQPTVLNDDHLLKIKVKCFPGINIARLHKTLTPKLMISYFYMLDKHM